MFFCGDLSTRKRVDLWERSSKERDRQKLQEQTRLECNRRLLQRQQNSAALLIVTPNFFATVTRPKRNIAFRELTCDYVLQDELLDLIVFDMTV